MTTHRSIRRTPRQRYALGARQGPTAVARKGYRHKTRGAFPGGANPARLVHVPADAEVGQLHFPFGVQQHVCRFNVPVKHMKIRVEEEQSEKHLMMSGLWEKYGFGDAAENSLRDRAAETLLNKIERPEIHVLHQDQQLGATLE